MFKKFAWLPLLIVFLSGCKQTITDNLQTDGTSNIDYRVDLGPDESSEGAEMQQMMLVGFLEESFNEEMVCPGIGYNFLLEVSNCRFPEPEVLEFEARREDWRVFSSHENGVSYDVKDLISGFIAGMNEEQENQTNALKSYYVLNSPWKILESNFGNIVDEKTLEYEIPEDSKLPESLIVVLDADISSIEKSPSIIPIQIKAQFAEKVDGFVEALKNRQATEDQVLEAVKQAETKIDTWGEKGQAYRIVAEWTQKKLKLAETALLNQLSKN